MIRVIAGVNCAGKSSIAGAAIKASGATYYNPVEEARRIHALFASRSMDDINGAVWREGVRRLTRAIADDSDFCFETTLGGQSITNLLAGAIATGVRVAIWYCGLEVAELHVERVRDRVVRGGHDIPEQLIRARCSSSMRNLCRLAEGCHEIAVYDNSLPLDATGSPRLQRVLHHRDGRWLHRPTADTPTWAKPVAAVLLMRSA